MLIPVTPDVAVGCVQGEDLFDIRKIVREKAKAIIKGLKLKLPATPSLRGGVLQGRLAQPRIQDPDKN
jgi:hypothetical protein